MTVTPPPAILALPGETVGNPKTRMVDATECRRLVTLVVREDAEGGRAYARTVVKANYDGNRPYSRTAPGHAWTANINFLGMEGLIDSARVPYYALFSGVPTYTNFTTNFRRGESDSSRWNQIVAEEWTEMLNRWKQFRWNNRAKEFEMLFEGWGAKLREDPTDWRFRAIPARSVLVPVGSPSCLDERVPFVVVRRDYRIHELYAKIADEDAARKRGWNVEQVQWAIKNACQKWGGPNWQQQPWELWQQKLKNHEIYGSYTDADVISCAHVLNMEFPENGHPAKVSHFIITEAVGGPDNKDGFLFKHPNAYDSYHEVLLVCFQNTGDGTWHSVRGLAYKSFRHTELQNRLLCRAVDNAFLAAGPIIQETSNKSGDATQMAVIGPITVLKAGNQFVDHRLGCDIQGVLAVSRVLENNLAQNIGHYNQRSLSRDDGRGEQPTATQVELQAGKETALSQAQIDSYYDDLDTEYEQMYETAKRGNDPESARFVKACLARGVPKEALENMGRVKANRLSGSASPEMRKRNAIAFAQYAPSLPEEGKRAFMDELIMVFYGPDKVDLFNPRVPQPDVDDALAKLENSALCDGIVPEVLSGMDNVKHLEIHLGYAKEKLAPLAQAIEAKQPVSEEELQDAYEYVQALGAHAEEHLAQLQGDPLRQQLYQMFTVELKNLVAFDGRLRGAILDAQRKAQQAALEEQNATALSVMDQAKVASAQNDMQIKQAKAANDIEIKRAKAVSSQQLSAWKADKENKRQTAKTIHEIGLDTLLAKNELNNERREE